MGVVFTPRRRALVRFLLSSLRATSVARPIGVRPTIPPHHRSTDEDMVTASAPLTTHAKIAKIIKMVYTVLHRLWYLDW